MTDGSNPSQPGLTKGARITGDQRSSLGQSFGQRYAGGESIRSIAQDTGRSYGFVHGVLKESGATLRGRGGATRGPRRGALDNLADQVEAATDEVASAVRTKAKAGKAKLEKAEKNAKAKTAKDDKSKRKVDTKKPAAAKKAAKKSGKKG